MDDRLLILAIPALPLLAAVLIGALGPRGFRGQSHWVAILAVAGSFAAAATLLARGPVDQFVNLYTWFTAGSFQATVTFHYDGLAAIMLFTVTLVSLLVIVYSREYMKGDPGYVRFFAYICLFVFAMCTLVLADNFLLLFLGWEGVGLCSYLLIGFFYQRPAAAAAAKKAFIVNRVGDFGVILGVLLIFLEYHTVGISALVAPPAGAMFHLFDPGPTPLIALLLLCGAIGKSGQLLLHVWLPDAMEGPSPVSALIHAATMVTAGVYLVARTAPIFLIGGAMPLVAVLGCATAFFAATIALVQVDIKRVLAYSTISQLGYMFLGMGVGVGGSAIFHLFTHAFFKALLFLSAGAIMHALADVIDLRKMGGLFRRLPLTAIVFLTGCLALAGIPGTAGFFSKDEIIGGAFAADHFFGHEDVFACGLFFSAGPGLGAVLGTMALVTAALTAFYTFRVFMRVFTGPERLPEETHGHVHRPGVWMSAPLVLLAIGSLAAGWFGTNVHALLDRMPRLWFWSTAIEHLAGPGEESHAVTLAGIVVPIVFALLAVILYGPLRSWTTNSGIDRTFIYKLLWNKYYIDEIYDLLIVRPLRAAGRLFVAFDDHGIDNALVGVTWAPRGLGWLLRRGQTGSLGGYAMVFAFGVALIGGLIVVLTYWSH